MEEGIENLKTPEPRKEFPLSWFYGSGREVMGKIITVDFSQKFEQLGGGMLLQLLATYKNCLGSKPDVSHIENDHVRATAEHMQEKIIAITGFSPEELLTKKSELEKLYKGKTADQIRDEKLPPIHIELF